MYVDNVVLNKECQYRDRNYKKITRKILELQSSVTEIKEFTGGDKP